MIRLQKVIAASGLASRRGAETMIQAGLVTVNGCVVWKLGTCIDPEVDHVKVNGRHLKTAEPEVFVLLNKPSRYVTTMKDQLGRLTIADLLNRLRVRVFPVGRLDYDSEGLLLLTNNGKVAEACLHPRFHVPKTYLVKVSGVFKDEEIKLLQEGVRLNDGVTSPAVVKKSGKAKINSWLEFTIYEGRKHQIKRMVEAIGHHVLRIRRTRFGPLALGDLPLGKFRYASDSEANALRAILQRYHEQCMPRNQNISAKLKAQNKNRDSQETSRSRKSFGLSGKSRVPRTRKAKPDSKPLAFSRQKPIAKTKPLRTLGRKSVKNRAGTPSRK